MQDGLKASEIIEWLQTLIEKHGDLHCVYYDDCGYCEIFSVGIETGYEGPRIVIG